MAIVAGDILLKLSVTTGSAGNSTAQGNVNNSLGKYISTTQVTDSTINNLFDNVSGTENAASAVDYRCVFYHNSHASLTAESMVVYLSSEVSGGASIAIGLDTTGATVLGSSPVQALTIANETTAPTGVSFSSPTTAGTGLSLGDLQAGYVYAIWVRRTSANNGPKNNDGVTLSFQLDTAE